MDVLPREGEQRKPAAFYLWKYQVNKRGGNSKPISMELISIFTMQKKGKKYRYWVKADQMNTYVQGDPQCIQGQIQRRQKKEERCSQMKI
ncbi:hypothetical protein CEXT_798111 [Caerostris extrusa]|uniref:Uncharacterized protein n=1 Tax=Caerostris extrusa TaxID=172846 RepID=A0AAV4V7D9_CAEEX|nr:hypothetical protein CEXT_798111 [Caerostris extrusa]